MLTEFFQVEAPPYTHTHGAPAQALWHSQLRCPSCFPFDPKRPGYWSGLSPPVRSRYHDKANPSLHKRQLHTLGGGGRRKVRMKPHDFDRAEAVFQGALCAGRADRFSADPAAAGPGARGTAPRTNSPGSLFPSFAAGGGSARRCRSSGATAPLRPVPTKAAPQGGWGPRAACLPAPDTPSPPPRPSPARPPPGTGAAAPTRGSSLTRRRTLPAPQRPGPRGAALVPSVPPPPHPARRQRPLTAVTVAARAPPFSPALT